MTLDDLWRLDLLKLDGWACVRENSAGEEVFKAMMEAAESSDEWEEDDGE